MVKGKYPNLVALEDEEFTRTYSQFKILKATAWAVGGCGPIDSNCESDIRTIK